MTHPEAQARLKSIRMTENEAMNLWQDAGTVSDNAVSMADVASSDLETAVRWVEELKVND